MVKTILFDLDGTLTDSSEGVIKCSLYAFSYYGITLPDDKLNTLIGPPLRYSFARYGVPEGEIENALERYRERYASVGKFENRPYDNIEDLLSKLKAAGHRLFVATSKPESLSVEILEHFGLSKYFEGICGATFDTSRDSKQAVIEYLLSTHKVNGEIIMVGDTIYDIEGASALGIPTICVGWGFGEKAELLEAGALGVTDTMDELFSVLK